MTLHGKVHFEDVMELKIFEPGRWPWSVQVGRPNCSNCYMCVFIGGRFERQK